MCSGARAHHGRERRRRGSRRRRRTGTPGRRDGAVRSVRAVKQSSPAALRNREAIADVLASVLPREGLVLGSRAAAASTSSTSRILPALTFQPSDRATTRARAHRRLRAGRSVRACCARTRRDGEMADRARGRDRLHQHAARVCAETLPSLMRGASAILAQGAPLVTYGAYKIGGAHGPEQRDLRRVAEGARPTLGSPRSRSGRARGRACRLRARETNRNAREQLHAGVPPDVTLLVLREGASSVSRTHCASFAELNGFWSSGAVGPVSLSSTRG